MEEESRFDRTLLSGNKDKVSFAMSHKKMLGYVWNEPGCHINLMKGPGRVWWCVTVITELCGYQHRLKDFSQPALVLSPPYCPAVSSAAPRR